MGEPNGVKWLRLFLFGLVELKMGYLEFYLTFVENLAETLETICAKNVSKVTFVPCLQNNRKNG